MLAGTNTPSPPSSPELEGALSSVAGCAVFSDSEMGLTSGEKYPSALKTVAGGVGGLGIRCRSPYLSRQSWSQPRMDYA